MHDAPSSTHGYRWAVLGGVWLMYFSFGVCVASTAPLIDVIARDLGTSYTAMGAVLGAWQLVYIAAALPLGALLDRIGVALGLTLSAGVMAGSLFLRGAAGDGTELFLAVALFGLGGPLVSIGAPKLITIWFHGPDRGMAMGIYITGVNIGAIVALAATNALMMPLTGGSWRAVLWIWGGIVLAAGVLWWALSRHPEARRRDGAAFGAGSGAGGVSKGESLSALLAIARLRVVRVVLLMSVGIFFVNHGLNNWLPEILRDKGMTPAAAGVWAAVPTVVGVLGALIIPRLAIPERRVAIMGALILAAIAATLLLQLAPGWGLATGLILQGIARSSMMTVAILLLMEAPGVPPARAGMAGGMFFTVAEIGGVLGPLSVGALSEVSGGFVLPLAAMTAVCVLLLALLGALRLLESVARGARSG